MGSSQRCKKHRLENDINTNNAKCGCQRAVKPYFAMPGCKPTHCAECRTDGMVNRIDRLCGCTRSVTAKFGFPGKDPTHCSECKIDGMVDTKSPQCGCHRAVRPYFAMPGCKPAHCAECKTDGMVNVIDRRCGCPRSVAAKFGFPGEKPIRCYMCKTDGMIDLKAPRCIGRCGQPCPTSEIAYYGAHCRYCTDDPKVAKRYKVTETRCLKEIFRALGPSATTTEQLCVNFACSDSVGTRAYVDAVVDHPNVRVLLEIDERQHSSYAASCDLKRMHAVVAELLLQSADARPIAWVRFNPDDGEEQAKASAQRRRCGEAVEAIRELFESPRNCIVYVNYV